MAMMRASNRKLGKLEKKEIIGFYLCLSPWIVGFLIFTFGPLIATLVISFCKWDLLSPVRFVGIRNYLKLVNDPLFWKSLQVTLIYTAGSLPLLLVGAIIVALLMNQALRGMNLFRTIYYMPAVISGVAVALLWRWIFNPDFGIINYFLSKIGIKGPSWLASETWALPALIIMSLWAVGATMIIYLARLQSIPTQLYEAAEIDGANAWQKLLKITLPMLTPVIFFNLIMGIIWSFQVFTQVYIMTQGGPHYATLFYVLYLYNKGFRALKMGYASTLAWVLFFIILALTLLIFKSSSRWVHYGGKR